MIHKLNKKYNTTFIWCDEAVSQAKQALQEENKEDKLKAIPSEERMKKKDEFLNLLHKNEYAYLREEAMRWYEKCRLLCVVDEHMDEL